MIGADGGRPKRVLITGAAGGLGAALAAALRTDGADVLATDVVAGDGVADSAGDAGAAGAAVDAVDAHLDVTSEQDWARAREEVLRRWGGLDLLINNAGVAGGGRLDRCGLEEWRWITEINLFGVVAGMRAFIPVFKAQHAAGEEAGDQQEGGGGRSYGHIVNIASLAGLVHPAGLGSYNAVKAAVVALTETAGHELAGYGIRASVACPSYFRTPLAASLRGADTGVGEVVAGLIASSPYSADEVAQEILAGVERGDELILPDPAAREAYGLKVTDPAAHARRLREQAAKLERIA